MGVSPFMEFGFDINTPMLSIPYWQKHIETMRRLKGLVLEKTCLLVKRAMGHHIGVQDGLTTFNTQKVHH